MLNIYIPRENNKKLPNILNLSDKQINYWKCNIFNIQNINKVQNASTKKSTSKSSKLSNREMIIQQIVSENISNNINVFRFIEKSIDRYEKLSIEQILEYVRIKFTKIISRNNMKKRKIDIESNDLFDSNQCQILSKKKNKN